MTVNTKKSRFRLLVSLFFALTICLQGCDHTPKELVLSDLNPAEMQYLSHYLIIERARAVYAVDPELGNSLLDSLAVAWGDSDAVEINSALPVDLPRRALVNRLLVRILEAEEDSLLLAARPDRLSAPITDPPPPAQP